MKVTLTIITELYSPEDSATAYVLTRIAEGLASYYEVKVLCAQPTYAKRGCRAATNEMRNGVRIHRCHSTIFNKNVLFLRFINILTISLSLFISAYLHLHKDEIVLVVTNPPLLPVLIAFACRLKRAKCLLITHDVYPQALAVTGLLAKDTLSYRVILYIMRWMKRQMRAIVVLGRDMHQLITDSLKTYSPCITVIPGWADLEQITLQPRESNALLRKLGLQGKFVLQYSGNMGRTHDLEIIVRCAIQCRQQEHIHFLLIGDGAKKKWVEAAIQANNLTNVTLLAPCSRSELNIQLNACDVALISFLHGMAGVSVPSRMYNVLAAGKPIIAVADTCSELALVVQEEHVGWVVPPGHAIALADAVSKAKSNPRSLQEMGARARKAAESKYSFARVIESYRKLITKLG
jgi:glycosyltransferase involved in cell wall biosynthesis